ncbi:MAG: universal stress protein [Syntrophomonadaceae bacterium]|nr:universal stress protein [Syntrophomonadaceae bacterium]
MFAKILVPVDGSDVSNKALDTAREMIEEGSAREVTILHVLQPSEVMPFNGLNMPVDYPQFYEELNKAAQRILENAEKRVALKEKSRIQLEYGSPVEIICKAAEQEKYDLIIIGNRGLNKFQRVLMGSVSSKVVTLAPCPVLIIK